MSFRFVAAAAILLCVVAFAATHAAARGGSGGHAGFGSFGHGFWAGRFHDGHNFHHVMHHGHYGRHWATHFHPWDGSRLSGHSGPWRPGHWHVTSGFGDHGRWPSHLEGVWGR